MLGSGQSVNRPLDPLISGDRMAAAAPTLVDGDYPERNARLTVASPTSPTLRINKFYVVSRPLLVRYLRADGKHIGVGKLEAQ